MIELFERRITIDLTLTIRWTKPDLGHSVLTGHRIALERQRFAFLPEEQNIIL